MKKIFIVLLAFCLNIGTLNATTLLRSLEGNRTVTSETAEFNSAKDKLVKKLDAKRELALGAEVRKWGFDASGETLPWVKELLAAMKNDDQSLSLLYMVIDSDNEAALRGYTLALASSSDKKKRTQQCWKSLSPLGFAVTRERWNSVAYCCRFWHHFFPAWREEKTELIKALMSASQAGQIEVVRTLVAEIDFTGTNMSSALLLASQEGHDGVVKLLLARRADVTKALPDGATPLWIASRFGHTEVVKLLLDRRADVNKARSDGVTPLYIASKDGHDGVVRQLLASGSDVNKALPSGATPLECASVNGHDGVVSQLLENGADANLAEKQTSLRFC